jgi:catechol 2,3-dioxygenase-like lactoylglutathione lyase family enzyme
LKTAAIFDIMRYDPEKEMSMLDHIGLRTKQLKEMFAFYEAVLAPLGYSKQKDFGVAAGFGKPGQHPLWIGQGEGETSTSSVHLALTAESRAAVDAFHRVALENGGTDNGPPGIRPQYHENYYGAFVIDPDGNNLEAVCHKPA